jgi:hypothetical protein
MTLHIDPVIYYMLDSERHKHTNDAREDWLGHRPSSDLIQWPAQGAWPRQRRRRSSLSRLDGEANAHWQYKAAIVWLPLVLVLPILAFAIVPSLFGRLVVIVLIGAAGLKQVTSTPELMSFMTIQAWSVAASM